MISEDSQLKRYRECLKLRETLEQQLKSDGLSYSTTMDYIKRLQRVKYYIDWWEGVNINPSYIDPNQLSF